jgi:Uma2 family endonuclease
MSILTQTDLPRPARETLPTMYDLPSEEIEEFSALDEYHVHQSALLSETFHPTTASPDEVFTATDLYLHYDPHRALWHKRPDWFAVIGVPHLYEGDNLRLSQVVWQKSITPLIVVEMISPGTEKEEIGQTLRTLSGPPTKWEVYGQVLGVPYYAILSRDADELRMFKLNEVGYTELVGHGGRFWIAEAELGLGLWRGVYKGPERLWLRWYDAQGKWIPTNAELVKQEREHVKQEREIVEQERARADAERERAEAEREHADAVRLRLAQERQRAEAERERAERLAEMLRQLGKDPDQL